MKENMYDAVIIGGGPAGLTAGLYLARARYRVLIVEKETFGGQITITSEVVNYPGVEKIGGKELTERMRRQAASFGAEFLAATVTAVDLDGEIREVTTDKGAFKCFSVIIATGAHPRSIGFQGEAEFKGRGVAYCATCDGEFFTGKEVFVVGGGYAAAEESVFLTKYASHVTILIREPDFTCAKATADAARSHPKITVVTDVEVTAVSGDDTLRQLTYRHTKTGEETVFTADNDTFGVFVFAGYVPNTELFRGLITLDDGGYIVTDGRQRTDIDGVYAAGDVCVKTLRQVVTATGDGAVAATEAERYCAAAQERTGLKPTMPAPAEATPATGGDDDRNELFTAEMLSQLNTVFDRMSSPLILALHLDDSDVAGELKGYMTELAALTDKLTVATVATGDDDADELPYVSVCRADGSETGLAFHGVPGGHEFTSFILGLYNAAGPGQPLDADLKDRAEAIDKEVYIKIMVSLTCTMCPDLVVAAQRLAALNPRVRADVYDLNHFPALKERYNVMSVPCYVINDGKPLFGKRSLAELLELI